MTRSKLLYQQVLDDIAEKARTGEVQHDVNCGLCGGPGTYVWLRDDTQPDPFTYRLRCSGCCSSGDCAHWQEWRADQAAARARNDEAIARLDARAAADRERVAERRRAGPLGPRS